MRVKFEGGGNTTVWGTVYGKNWVEAFPERMPVGAVIKISFRALPPYSRYVETSNVKFEIHINDFGFIDRVDI
uniref:Galectin n=1 Tax=Panagrolaimus sp. PS1159 TaxID=55785 RepID=A0AC35F3X7_9BILA